MKEITVTAVFPVENTPMYVNNTTLEESFKEALGKGIEEGDESALDWLFDYCGGVKD